MASDRGVSFPGTASGVGSGGNPGALCSSFPLDGYGSGVLVLYFSAYFKLSLFPSFFRNPVKKGLADLGKEPITSNPDKLKK